jgi:hypothetical protein
MYMLFSMKEKEQQTVVILVLYELNIRISKLIAKI